MFQFGRCLFFINRNVFRHLKLDIALAIPALNELKILWKNSAGQGLKIYAHSPAHNDCPFFYCTVNCFNTSYNYIIFETFKAMLWSCWLFNYLHWCKCCHPKCVFKCKSLVVCIHGISVFQIRCVFASNRIFCVTLHAFTVIRYSDFVLHVFVTCSFLLI